MDKTKCKILEKATDMFLNLGFKSVTMDDISNALCISKKTIYSHYKTKTKLVEESTFHVFNKITSGINQICEKKQNSIHELFEVKKYIYATLNSEKSSPQHQLQKFFPEIHSKMKKKHFETVQSCVLENLSRGIEEGYYRKNINLDFISRIYFIGINGIKDQDTFPDELFSKNDLMTTYLEYHIRAIATQKGIEKLEQTLKTE